MNYFAPSSVADRYAKGRPDFHQNTINRVQQYLALQHPLEQALDVACGTGLSSKALLGIAKIIHATDVSQPMLSNAYLHERISYQCAFAEQQPYGNEEFDMITVSSGIHWFDIDRFLVEAHRLLRTQGYLVVYDNFFNAILEGDSEFSTWHKGKYLKMFPAPKRKDSYPFNQSTLEKIGFNFVHEEEFTNDIEFTMAELILYFTTQSNITEYISRNNVEYAEIESWLASELHQFFPNESKRTFQFGNWIKFLKKI